jgi:type II secretory pathway pseudopilin PulG
MLIEIIISFLLFTMAVAGAIYGYTQANRTADFAACSLAGQSQALQGAEQARGAAWNPFAYPMTYGANGADQLAGTNGLLPTGPVFTTVDFMDIPSKGTTNDPGFSNWVTNYVYVTQISANPYLRQIRSDAIWTYPTTGVVITNTVMDLRAPDQ